jgi:hypothetical protein
MKKQIPPQEQKGTHFERFMDVTRKVLTTSLEELRQAEAAEKQEKAKKNPQTT